ALTVRPSTAGGLLLDKQLEGRGGETATGIAVAPDDSTVYVAGTTTTFGAGSQDAFVLHLLPSGKKLLDAVTWGGSGFEEGSGVGVIAGTVALSATTSNPPPYSLLDASARLSTARGVRWRLFRESRTSQRAPLVIRLPVRQRRTEVRSSAETSRAAP